MTRLVCQCHFVPPQPAIHLTIQNACRARVVRLTNGDWVLHSQNLTQSNYKSSSTFCSLFLFHLLPKYKDLMIRCHVHAAVIWSKQELHYNKIIFNLFCHKKCFLSKVKTHFGMTPQFFNVFSIVIMILCTSRRWQFTTQEKLWWQYSVFTNRNKRFKTWSIICIYAYLFVSLLLVKMVTFMILMLSHVHFKIVTINVYGQVCISDVHFASFKISFPNAMSPLR